MKIIRNLSLILQNINLAKSMYFPALALNSLSPSSFFRWGPRFRVKRKLGLKGILERSKISFNRFRTSAGRITQASKLIVICSLCLSSHSYGSDFLKQFVKTDASQKFFMGVIEEKQKLLDECIKEQAELEGANQSFTEKVARQIDEVKHYSST